MSSSLRPMRGNGFANFAKGMGLEWPCPGETRSCVSKVPPTTNQRLAGKVVCLRATPARERRSRLEELGVGGRVQPRRRVFRCGGVRQPTLAEVLPLRVAVGTGP